MNDDQYFLASAYLDGELTDDERRIAERDPDVMSIVAELDALHTTLHEAPPTEPSIKQAAISAAMAEFTQAGLTRAEPVQASRTGAQQQRPWRQRYLAVAAAVLVIGLVGVVAATVISGGLSGTDDDASDSAIESSELQGAADDGDDGDGDGDASVIEDAQDDSSATGAMEESRVTVAADAVSEDSGDDSGDHGDAPASASADSDMADDPGDASGDDMAEDDSADEDDMAGDDTAGDEAPGETYSAIEPVADPDTTLTTPGQLTGYGFYLLDRIADGTIGATIETECVHPESIGDIPILDTAVYLLDGVERELFIAVDESSGQAFAIDPTTCELLVTGTAP